MDERGLLPCPFCGGQAELKKQKAGRFSAGYYSVVHMCSNYISIVCASDTAELAAEKWNTRTGWTPVPTDSISHEEAELHGE